MCKVNAGVADSRHVAAYSSGFFTSFFGTDHNFNAEAGDLPTGSTQFCRTQATKTLAEHSGAMPVGL